MEEARRIITLILKAVALAMAVVSIVMGFFPDVGDVNTHITLLGIGLFTLSVAAFQKEEGK